MGLAQRFKDKLNKKDIFEKPQIEKDLEANDIKFISKPITESFTVQPKELHSGVNDPVKNLSELRPDLNLYNKFEDLETEIIEKIRKTPYWQDYDVERQANMINAYFDKRCQCEFTTEEKEEFIGNILALANNR